MPAATGWKVPASSPCAAASSMCSRRGWRSPCAANSSMTRSTRSVSSSWTPSGAAATSSGRSCCPRRRCCPPSATRARRKSSSASPAKLEKKGGADALVKTLRGDAESLRRHIVPVRERPRARGGLSAKNYGGGLSRAADDCGRGGVRPHRREPEGLFVAAEGGRLHRVRKRLARGRACGAGTERGRADGEARRLRPLSDGEPADEPGICSRRGRCCRSRPSSSRPTAAVSTRRQRILSTI